MAGLTRSKQDVNPKDVQAMFLKLAASQGMPFAEAGAEYLLGNLEDAKSSAAIDAVLSALPVAGVAAKPVARAVKRAAPVTKELLHDAFNAAQEAGLIQGPAYAVPQSNIQNVKENILKNYGKYGAQRVERAADEIPNLGNLYTEQAMLRAFGGDNAKALMTIDPKNFEQYAHRLSDSKEGVIDTLKKLVGGFEDVPFLEINKEEYGLPLMPFISGHEGRHRSRAMSELGENASLVQLLPRAELREPFPRRSQEEYVNALKEELALMDNMVLPEREALLPQRPAIKLPDIYAKGGSATKSVKKRSKNG
jgi:hypothetical protein